MKGDTRQDVAFFIRMPASLFYTLLTYMVYRSLLFRLFYNKMKKQLFIPVVASKRNNFYRNDVFVYAIN